MTYKVPRYVNYRANILPPLETRVENGNHGSHFTVCDILRKLDL